MRGGRYRNSVADQRLDLPKDVRARSWTLEEAVAADTSLLSRKTERLPEGNVDVEPPSSMDDSSMIMIEIGVDVDESTRPNMTNGDGARSSVGPS